MGCEALHKCSMSQMHMLLTCNANEAVMHMLKPISQQHIWFTNRELMKDLLPKVRGQNVKLNICLDILQQILVKLARQARYQRVR